MRSNNEKTISPAPYQADWDLLWHILETEYPYLGYLRKKGVDVEGIRAEYEEQVREAAEPKAFSKIVDQVLEKLHHTAHLWRIEAEESGFYYYVYKRIAGDDPFYTPWIQVLEKAAADGAISLPERGEEDSSDQNSLLGELPAVEVSWYEEEKVLCFTIPIFHPDMVERDKDLVRESLEKYPEAEHIVFDITGNGGGDSRYWTENIVPPFGEDYSFSCRIFYKDTPTNGRIFEKKSERRDSAEADHLPPWVAEMGLDKYLLMSDTIKGRPEISSKAKCWVLVDQRVYSSSEMFTCFCKGSGWATVAGTHTGGDGIGQDPFLYYLPDSGLLLSFSNFVGEVPGGAMSIEGTEPDVVLEKADMEHLLEVIRRSSGVTS